MDKTPTQISAKVHDAILLNRGKTMKVKGRRVVSANWSAWRKERIKWKDKEKESGVYSTKYSSNTCMSNIPYATKTQLEK